MGYIQVYTGFSIQRPLDISYTFTKRAETVVHLACLGVLSQTAPIQLSDP